MLDPDPESASLMRIRNQGGHLNADPYGSGSETLMETKTKVLKYRVQKLMIYLKAYRVSSIERSSPHCMARLHASLKSWNVSLNITMQYMWCCRSRSAPIRNFSPIGIRFRIQFKSKMRSLSQFGEK